MSILDALQRALAPRYVLEREIGAGGMATVYLARDMRHERYVAVKVLKPELGAILGVERFLSEIKVTASLQHPNLLPLFDSGEVDGLLFYVMPFVEGETLRRRLERERQLPVDEAVRIGVSVTSALEYAHGHGVIHRDLKPENILIHAGQPLIADFGIALAVSNAGGARLTQTGLSLGTPQYMSPEQAAGDKAVDRRTDIYSLAAVIYEMLAGEPPHTGSSAQAIIAKLMTTEPRPLRSVRPAVPNNVSDAVQKALGKLPADRFHSPKEFGDALTNPAFTTSAGWSAAGTVANARRFQRLFYASAGMIAVTAAVAIIGWNRTPTPRPNYRYALALDSTEALKQSPSFFWSRLAISPDGSRIVYVGGPQEQLLVRARDHLQSVPLPGTEGARTPFFSPDGNSIGFSVGSTLVLKTVSIDGGIPVTLADSLAGTAGASWARDGTIYCDAQADAGLVRVAARAGSVPTPFTTVDRQSGEQDHEWPEVLPNGKGVLFSVIYDAAHGGNSAIAIADIPTGDHRILLRDASHPRFASGYIVYLTSGSKLMAVPFDQDALRVSGEPISLSEEPRSIDFAPSREGTLTYAMHGSVGRRELVWVTRSGQVTALDPLWQGDFDHPSLSPDGADVAVAVFTDLNGLADIWVKKIAQGTLSKLTLHRAANWFPAWTPDSHAVTFASPQDGHRFDLWTKRVDGNGQQTLQLRWKQDVFESVWSRDGRWLLVSTSLTGNPGDGILGVRPGVDSVATSKIRGQEPAMSPDGRYVAYMSNETGRSEIYVVPFPNTGAGKWLVSTQGGIQPLWSHNGKELFYRSLSGDMMSATISTVPTFVVGRTTVLFRNAGFIYDGPYRQYDISRDDQRFLMLRPVSAGSDKIVMVENWLSELNPRSHR